MTSKPIRIAALMFVHETVTFLNNDTTVDDFTDEGSPAKGEALLKPRLNYENVDLKKYYPCGEPAYPPPP